MPAGVGRRVCRSRRTLVEHRQDDRARPAHPGWPRNRAPRAPNSTAVSGHTWRWLAPRFSQCSPRRPVSPKGDASSRNAPDRGYRSCLSRACEPDRTYRLPSSLSSSRRLQSGTTIELTATGIMACQNAMAPSVAQVMPRARRAPRDKPSTIRTRTSTARRFRVFVDLPERAPLPIAPSCRSLSTQCARSMAASNPLHNAGSWSVPAGRKPSDNARAARNARPITGWPWTAA